MGAPTFSIIIPHYEGSVTAYELTRCLESLRVQLSQDFEILLYHDGPKSIPFEEEIDLVKYSGLAHVEATTERYNDWGHTLRDMGIRQARGEYIIHLNADNILYPNAISELLNTISHSIELTGGDPTFLESRSNIIIMSILMVGMATDGKSIWYEERGNPQYSLLLTGFPTNINLIDCMQLVMKRSLWLDYDGWYDKAIASDGVMYPRFVNENGAVYCSKILGEHW
jgi:glycosyltransferase involved in cell wall biosynthesis